MSESKLDEISAPIQVDGKTYLIFDKQQIKDLFKEVVGAATYDYDIAQHPVLRAVEQLLNTQIEEIHRKIEEL